MRGRSKGFTLIELVMIIVILGILAAVAIPKYFNLRSDALRSAEEGVVGGVRAGIATYFVGHNLVYPGSLDSAVSNTTAATNNPFFDTVLSQGGITADWTKSGASTYVGPYNGTYVYNSSDGSFTKQ